MTLIEVTVARKRQEAEQVFSFELVRADGSDLPPFQAGDHVDVHLPGGLVRQYSLCNAPGETRTYLVAVLREAASRGGSRTMAESVREGDRLFISPPRSLFPLREDAPHSLLLAGGIGITPIIAMAERLSRLGKPFTLHYCGRTAAAMAFRLRLEIAPFARDVFMHTDDGHQSQVFNMDVALGQLSREAHVYVCGPGGFIDAVFAAAGRCGIPGDRLHREYFSPPERSTGEAPFTLRLSRSGRDIPIPADKTVTEVLVGLGIEIPVSCERGICGTCLTTVTEGVPDHRDSFLTPAERSRNASFTPCCSRSKTAVLAIDL